jgi:hypothetical protein
MDFGAITNAEETYDKALLHPNVSQAILMVIIAGLISGLIVPIATGNFLGLLSGVIISIVQWVSLIVTLWFLYMMFKKKRTSELSFNQIGSAVGKLWSIVILFNLLLLVGIIISISGLLNGLIGIILFILFVVVGIALVYSHYKLVKAMFSANKGRHIIVWLSSMLISGIVSGLVISLINLVF